MNIVKHLILVKDEDKTEEIEYRRPEDKSTDYKVKGLCPDVGRKLGA